MIRGKVIICSPTIVNAGLYKLTESLDDSALFNNFLKNRFDLLSPELTIFMLCNY